MLAVTRALRFGDWRNSGPGVATIKFLQTLSHFSSEIRSRGSAGRARAARTVQKCGLSWLERTIRSCEGYLLI